MCVHASFRLLLMCSVLGLSLLAPAPTTTPAGNTTACPEMTECEQHDPVTCACLCPSNKEDPDSAAHYYNCPFYNVIGLAGLCYRMRCAATTVWNQEQCRCLKPLPGANLTGQPQKPAKKGLCQLLIDYRYNKEKDRFVDYQNNHIRTDKGGNYTLETVSGATTASTALRFNGSLVYMPILLYNGLGDTTLIKTRIHPDTDGPTDSQTVISNGCYSKDKTHLIDTPSIEITYARNPGNFTVRVNTQTDQIGTCMAPFTDDSGWFEVSISMKSSNTTVSINGNECVKIEGEGLLGKTGCPLTIGGDPLRPAYANFYGHLDYIKLFKYCYREDVP